MSLLDLVQQQLGQPQLQQISQQIGADPAQTQSAVQAALPMLLGGMAAQGRQPGGANQLAGAVGQAQGLGGMFGGGGGGGLGGMLGGLLGGAMGGGAAAGSGGLGGLLGSLGGLGGLLGGHEGDVQQGVQQASGLNGDQTKKLLLILAPIVLAALAHRRSQAQQERQVALPGQGAGQYADSDGDGIPDYLEQEARQAGTQVAQQQPAIGGILGKILGAAQRPPR